MSSEQVPEALVELERAAELTESTLAVEGAGFSVLDVTPAVGGQLITVQGIAGRYDDLFLPLFGRHQAHNAAVAIAAVESFLGRGTQVLDEDVLSEGLAGATSPGRLQPIATDPTVVVDAAHNPHGAKALAEALPVAFPSEHVVGVVGILGDKDARGFVRALKGTVETFVVTQPPGSVPSTRTPSPRSSWTRSARIASWSSRHSPPRCSRHATWRTRRTPRTPSCSSRAPS
ncbi:cyanophycin synthetase [Sphingomonas sp. LR61]|uniref:glutamate ligase domain-containing protein n=1 Tax=Sphingomonas sp. LR61 TaxID=3050234 RepID=UPI002FE047E2